MTITATFDGRCAKCGGAIRKDSEIEYEKKTGSAWHPECFEDEGGRQDFDAESLADACHFMPHGDAIQFVWSGLPKVHVAD